MQDPNSSTGKITIDKNGIQAFIEERVKVFATALDHIMKDDEKFGPTLETVLGTNDYTETGKENYNLKKPLAIGFMEDPQYLNGRGSEIQQGLRESAESIIALYKQHIDLIAEIEEALTATIKEFLTTQGSNLTKVGGREFLEGVEDVIDALEPSSTEGSGDEE
ncbi:type VII secretion system-associated protein [Streptomyces sp. NPDC020681]|uniref:type VII secretion system-associated protein n=1 Tax=Streptomyces sp. NPDC020681 TaxID=3365083 RepID=UPI0037B91DDA